VLLATTKHFAKSLLPWTSTDTDAAVSSVDEGLKSVLTLLASGEEGYYGVRARWGWYREFIRLYSTHLVQLDEVVERDVLGQFKGKSGEGIEGRAGSMVRDVWAAGVRGEE
jgi:nuclear cap-binding protein subunit 1